MLTFIKKYLPMFENEKPSNVAGYEFLQAAKSGNRIAIKVLRSRHPALDVNYLDSMTKKSALHFAVESKEIELVKLILDLGIDMSLRDQAGFTALMRAVEFNFQRATKMIVESQKGALGHASLDGETAVNVALRFQREKVALFLIEKGEDLDRTLRCAIRKGDWSQIAWLCRSGANPNLLDGESYSPLVRAIQADRLEDFRRWINHGADINFTGGNGPLLRMKGWTPLMVAIELGRRSIIDELLGKPTLNFSTMAGNGWTALSFALKAGDLETIRQLERLGCAVSTETPATVDGLTPLMLAAQSGNLSTVEFVLERAARSIDVQDKIGWTALIFAVHRQAVEVVRLLIQYGANRSVTSKDHKFDARRVAASQRVKAAALDPKSRSDADEILSLIG